MVFVRRYFESFQQRFHFSITLLILGVIAALISIFTLLFQFFGIAPMSMTITYVGLPSLAILAAIGLYARRTRQEVFVNRLLVGFVAGLLATIAYDGIRFVIQITLTPSTNLFHAMTQFGLLITAQAIPTSFSELVGWGYHYWNGFTFGITYTLIVGKGRWYYGLAWALFLESAMLVLYPRYMGVEFSSDFIFISLAGHVAYGVVLGYLSQRYIHPN